MTIEPRGESPQQTFAPTPEQQAILDAVADMDGPSVLVEAGAGVGKTSVLEQAATRVRTAGLAIAFNKKIATEMANRLPSNFNCKTMNSLGHSAWAGARGLRANNLKLDDKKPGKIITEMAKSNHTQLDSDTWDAARLLFRQAQIQGLVPRPFCDQFGTLVEDSESGWLSLALDEGIDRDDFELVYTLARDALIENIRLAYQGIISFDDQIYCSTMLGGKFAKYPMVFVDEDQDLNPLQIRMVQQSIGPPSRILAVGDRCQSIYAFRGAVGEAAEQLRALRPQWIDLPLMTSFRVPQLVADRQRGHVPLFRAHGANPTGKIHQWPNSTDTEGEAFGWSWKTVIDNLPEWPSELAILCRNNAPLLSLAFKLIRQGVGCHVLGRDLGKGLKALLKKICPQDTIPAPQVRDKITEWLNRELAKADLNDRSDSADKYNDKAECLMAILDSAECRDAGQLRAMIDKLFSRDSGIVTLSTIHKAKGLEWTSVIHLDPWRLPSKFALKAGGRALEQERNLQYVAETRTKHTLILANLEDFV